MSSRPDWTFRPVTVDNWHDLTALFEGRGGPRRFWCMVWRKDRDDRSAKPGAEVRRAALENLVQVTRPIGLLGYACGEPVAWCSVAPRSSFSKSLSGTEVERDLWSLTCFFIRADHRRQSGFAALIGAAETHARRMGAKALEAYPVEPDSPSYRFCGFLPKFHDLGYQHIALLGTRRHVVRKALS